jgi:hypothetical protein
MAEQCAECRFYAKHHVEHIPFLCLALCYDDCHVKQFLGKKPYAKRYFCRVSSWQHGHMPSTPNKMRSSCIVRMATKSIHIENE